jgi:hypothetical protein
MNHRQSVEVQTDGTTSDPLRLAVRTRTSSTGPCRPRAIPSFWVTPSIPFLPFDYPSGAVRFVIRMSDQADCFGFRKRSIMKTFDKTSRNFNDVAEAQNNFDPSHGGTRS